MTPLQQAYLTKLHATAAANLEFFKLNMAALYRRVVAANPLPTLDISDQGDLSIRYPDGASRPAAAAQVELEKRLREFADPQIRPQLLAFHSLRAATDDPSHGEMQRYHYSKLDAEFPDRARRHFAAHYPDNDGLFRYPSFDSPRTIPLLIVIGSAAGSYLTRLVLEYDIRHLVVMDVDEDAFRVSLFFQDYVELSRLALEKGTDLSIVVGPDIAHLTRGLMAVLRTSLPPFFVHGAALCYAMPEGEASEAIKTSIVDTLWQLWFGLGYFDDELISIRHSERNLALRRPVYSRPLAVDPQAVAFVVGSGPSLDGLLPLLRAQQGRAVLFSCGTALGALAHADIVPDFHVEKERPGIVFDVIGQTVPESFRRQTRLIGLNVVKPEVFDLFGWGGMVMKESDTMASTLRALGQAPNVPIDSQPTVTNFALSLALTLGFRRIYLVGVDMGYRDRARHHSRHTVYLGKLPDAGHLRRLLERRSDGERSVPANFGGEALADPILDVARLYMENTIRACPHARIFNLNDGAAIAGAEALPPEEFSGLADAADKQAAIDAIVGAFVPVDYARAPLREALLGSMDKLIGAFRELRARPLRTREEVMDAIVALYRHINAPECRDTAAGILFRGTVFNLLSLCYNALTIIADGEEAVAKAEYDLDNLMDALEAGRDLVRRALDEDCLMEEE